MIRVYNYMTAGVALTGLVAWFTYSAAVVDTGAGLQLTQFGHAIFASPLMSLLVGEHPCRVVAAIVRLPLPLRARDSPSGSPNRESRTALIAG